MAAIPFDKIVPGASVRFTMIDLVIFLSVRDVIMHLCGKNRKRANEVWERLSVKQKSELVGDISIFQFPGQGQSKMPVITIEGAMKLMMMLPGERAKHMRVHAADILSRYVQGKDSLIAEIHQNKQIGPVAACTNLAERAVVKASQYKEMPRVSYVYGTKSDAFPGLIKIGRTLDVDARLASLNTGCAPAPHYVVAVAPTFDASRDEAWAHAFFSSNRKHGEFFEVTVEEVKTFFANHIMTKYQLELVESIASIQGDC
jgi:hypothetical protein